jgi:hypothetical protein
MEPIIQHGALPENVEIVNEPDMLVQSLTVTPAREKKAYKGGNKATQGLQYTDPTMTFNFDAIISELAGLCDQHPGTAVPDLLNFAAVKHGFDPAEGMMIYEDPVQSNGVEDDFKITFNVFHYPFVEAAA